MQEVLVLIKQELKKILHAIGVQIRRIVEAARVRAPLRRKPPVWPESDGGREEATRRMSSRP